MKSEFRKKRNIKKLISVFCAAVLLLSCTACGGHAAESTALPEVSTESPDGVNKDGSAETTGAAANGSAAVYEIFDEDDAVGIQLLDRDKKIASADYTIIGCKYGDDGRSECYYNLLSGVALTPENGKCSVPKDAAIAELELAEGAGYALLTEVKETAEGNEICWTTDCCSVSGEDVQVVMNLDKNRSVVQSVEVDYYDKIPAFETMLAEHFSYIMVSSRSAESVPSGTNAESWSMTGVSEREFEFDETAAGLPVKAVPVSQLEDGFLYQIHILYEDGSEYTTEPEILQEGNGKSLEPFRETRETVKENYMTFTLYQDHAALTGYDDSVYEEGLIIPEYVGDLPVTVIAYGACANKEKLREVDFPDTLRRIEGNAFYGDSLRVLYLPENIEYIGENAFGRAEDETDQHTNVTVSLGENVYWIGENAFSNFNAEAYVFYSGNQTYSAIDGALCSADGTWLYSVQNVISGAFQVPDGITTVAQNAFQETAVTEISMSDSVKIFNMNGLPDTVSSLVIGSGLEDLIYMDASQVMAIDAVTISEENKNYCIHDGLLCDAEQNLLFACLQKEDIFELVLPDSLTQIRSDAFSGNTTVWSLKIPAKLSMEASELSAVLASLPNLSEITVDEDSEKYMAKDGVLYSADGSLLIAYPAGKTDAAYEVPEGVTAICGDAFPADCLLAELQLPQTLSALHAENEEKNVVCFADVQNLSDVYVADGNRYFSSTGAMFTDLASGRLLFFSPNCSDYILKIPEGTRAIEDAVFEREKLQKVTEVRIPEGVSTIGDDNFNMIVAAGDQWDILDIYLPDSLTVISERSFEDSDKIVIHASAGSYAAEFAQQHGIPFEAE